MTHSDAGAPEWVASLSELFDAELAHLGVAVTDVLVAEYRVNGSSLTRARIEVTRGGATYHLYADETPNRRVTLEENLGSFAVDDLVERFEDVTGEGRTTESVPNADLRELDALLGALGPGVLAETAVHLSRQSGDYASLLLAPLLERGVLFVPANPLSVGIGLDLARDLADGAPLEWALRRAATGGVS